MIKLMANTKIFIYPELLPKLACFEVEFGMYLTLVITFFIQSLLIKKYRLSQCVECKN